MSASITLDELACNAATLSSAQLLERLDVLESHAKILRGLLAIVRRLERQERKAAPAVRKEAVHAS
jgi:hypothetical protein